MRPGLFSGRIAGIIPTLMPSSAKKPEPAASFGDPASIYVDRLARASHSAAEHGTPHLLVTNPQDVAYLTGFMGGDSYLLLGGDRPLLLSDFRYQEELLPVQSFCDLHIRTGSMTEAVAKVITQADVDRLGVQGEHMTLGLRQAIGLGVRGVKLVETSGLVAKLRARKDPEEIKLIRKAIRIQQEAFVATLDSLARKLKKTGAVAESEIAAMLEFEMKIRGSSKPGFETIIAAKANGSLPHYRPGSTRLRLNQPLLIDWGAIYRGYHGDMTRVVCFGKWPRKIEEIYRIVLDAQQTAAAALAPGKSTAEIDAIARDLIRQAGYGDYFGHGLGHGMGLDGHEDPRLTNMLAPSMLEPGNVVTVEPGIYLPGIGGVRIEDDYLITDNGAVNLCSLPKDFDWASR